MADKKFSEVARAAQQVRDAVSGLRAQEATLIGEVRALEARNAEIRAAPLAAPDVKRFINDTIDRLGAAHLPGSGLGAFIDAFAFPRGSGRAIAPHGMSYEDPRFTPQPLCLADVDKSEREGPEKLESLFGERVYRLFGRDRMGVPAAFCFFFGDALKAKVEAHFDTLCPEATAAGFGESSQTSIAVRRDELAANGERIEALQGELSEVRRQLGELGV